jgi:ABC-2 type transport system ATP-binding protein
MATKAIKTENLSKFYGKNIGIQNINLEVDTGEIYGFIGPNGAGKSTAIRTLLNLIFPTSGRAEIFGLDIVKQSKQIKFITGYLPAEVNYYYKMTANELLEYSVRFYPTGDKNRMEYLSKALDLNLNMKIRDMSLGNKKKVSIVQALLHKPQLLILDEPTSGLDPLIQSTVFELLKEENQRGTTIFFSSHVLSDVQKICSKVAIIQMGSIIKEERIETLQDKMFKKISLELSRDSDLFDFSQIGAIDLIDDDTNISFMFKGDMNDLVRVIAELEIKNITIEEPTLEEIFLHYYRSTESND